MIKEQFKNWWKDCLHIMCSSVYYNDMAIFIFLKYMALLTSQYGFYDKQK